MVIRLDYDEALYRLAEDCMAAIAGRVAEGWQVSSIRRSRGAYIVVYRLETEC